MIPFQPGFLNPVVAARMTASLQRATGGRALFNIITGGGGPAQLWWGDSTGHDDRYGRTTEFLDILKGVWNGGPFSYQGKFYQVEDAGLPSPLSEQEYPEIYFSGSSDAALASASKHADFYLSWLEPFDKLREKFDRVKQRSEILGRKIKCAVRVDIIARPTEEEAWEEVRRGFDALPKEVLDNYLKGDGGDSVGAARQQGNRPTTFNSYKDLIIEPNVWSGFSLLRGGQTNGIVGSYEQVAERLDQLVSLGADAFILASTPHLEEAYRVGEEVLPLVRGKTSPLLRAVG
jgi:alkanesulfonate monooxygenase